MHSIENEYMKVSVRNQGAELCSLFDKQNNIEHLWQADPTYWAWHAPMLFPVVGRCWNDTLLIDGKPHRMEKHGFARNTNFQLISKLNNSLSFLLRSSESTLTDYPYHFDLQVTYTIHAGHLVQEFEVLNRGDESMYFQLGGHPAFAVPFIAGEAYEDYFIEFESDTMAERYSINEAGFFDGKKAEVLNGSNRLLMDKNMFADDALIFKTLKSRKVTIGTTKNLNRFSVSFPAFEYLGLWAKVNAPFVCIEPWLGCADTVDKPVAIAEKEGIITLGSGREFKASIIMSFE